jgi:hypothetical protein
LPEDALEDMMIAEVDNVQDGNRGIPGQMPVERDTLLNIDHQPAMDELGDEDLDVVEEDEEEEEISVSNIYGPSLCRGTQLTSFYTQPLPVRILRNVFNRFFGFGGHTEQEPDSDEELEENEPRDLGGVD